MSIKEAKKGYKVTLIKPLPMSSFISDHSRECDRYFKTFPTTTNCWCRALIALASFQ
jgi:hypothetical protein